MQYTRSDIAYEGSSLLLLWDRSTHRLIVLINSLDLSFQQLLQKTLERSKVQVWIQFLAGQVAQVLGVLGSVVAPDTPRSLVLDASSCDESTVIPRVLFDSLLGFLVLLFQLRFGDVLARNLFSGQFFKLAVYVVEGPDLVVGQNVFVQSSRIGDDGGHVGANVVQVRQGGWGVSVDDERVKES